MPPTIKIFLWQVGNDILPPKYNLYCRKIIESAICPICLREEETVVHAIWSCPVAMDVWTEKGSLLQKSSSCAIDFKDLWINVRRKLKKKNCEGIATLMKGI